MTEAGVFLISTDGILFFSDCGNEALVPRIEHVSENECDKALRTHPDIFSVMM